MTDDIANMSDEEFQKMMAQEVSKFVDQEEQNQLNANFDNVMQDDYDPYKMEQGDYLTKVFYILKEKLPDFETYTFIVHNSNSYEQPFTANHSLIGDKKVLIWTSGENKYHPEHLLKGKYHHVFAQYYWDTDNITSIPLGCYAKIDDEMTLTPMNERLFNMSFIGCLNRNRLELASIISKIPKTLMILSLYNKPNFMLNILNHLVKFLLPKNYFMFTDNFGKGFDQKSYSNLLSSSKIVLCPRGWTNTESFRIYEAMKAGCVVITEALPDRSYYKGIPVMQVDNWKDGLDLARYYLKHPYLLEKKGAQCRKFYEEKLSPEATAKIIMDKLAEKAI